jgi:NAD(P)H-flavin reductase
MLSVVSYVMRRRADYGRVLILRGVLHVDDMIWRDRYDAWNRHPDTQVLLAADITDGTDGYRPGAVVDLFADLDLDTAHSAALLCGAERMMLPPSRNSVTAAWPMTGSG